MRRVEANTWPGLVVKHIALLVWALVKIVLAGVVLLTAIVALGND